MLNDLTVTLNASDLRIPIELVEAIAKRAWLIGVTDNMAASKRTSADWEAHRAAMSQSYLNTVHDVLTNLTALRALTNLDFEALPFWTICCRCYTDRDVVVIPTGSLARLTPLCPACLQQLHEETVAYWKEYDARTARQAAEAARRRWYDPRTWKVTIKPHKNKENP